MRHKAHATPPNELDKLTSTTSISASGTRRIEVLLCEGLRCAFSCRGKPSAGWARLARRVRAEARNPLPPPPSAAAALMDLDCGLRVVQGRLSGQACRG